MRSTYQRVPNLSRKDLKTLSGLVREDLRNGSLPKKDAKIASYLHYKLLKQAYVINSKHINSFEWRWLVDNGYKYEAAI